jgi:Methyltransferase domain
LTIPKGYFSFPPGHFYSPIPSIEEIKKREKEIFGIPENVAGIDLNVGGQLALLGEFKKYFGDIPFGPHIGKKSRFDFQNPSYSHGDAIILYSMIRHLRPKRIIEIGSGHSSCITLDTNERFFENAISCTFIEPYPELLLSLIRDADKEKIELVPHDLQDVEMSMFSELTASDILFIDSTHVSKVGSDVNYIFFKLLPSLDNGVVIHFHDIFYPFEYPKEWFYEGSAWNEAYLLRAFLQNNNAYQIQFFNSYFQHFHRDDFFNEMPFPVSYAGGSIWMKKC